LSAGQTVVPDLVPADPFTQKPDFRSLLPTCDNAEIQAIHAWYTAEFERRVADVTEKLRAEVVPWKQDGDALLLEIAAVQTALEQKDEELTIKLADDAFPFSTILRLRTEKLELTSYLKGLKFRAAGIRVDHSDARTYNETASTSTADFA
jgi:hypothetical protein